jgi:hypothetical protein
MRSVFKATSHSEIVNSPQSDTILENVVCTDTQRSFKDRFFKYKGCLVHVSVNITSYIEEKVFIWGLHSLWLKIYR